MFRPSQNIINEKTHLYQLISECLTTYMLEELKVFFTNEEPDMVKVRYCLDDNVLYDIDMLFGRNSKFLTEQVKEIRQLLEDNEMHTPDLFKEYIIMKLIFLDRLFYCLYDENESKKYQLKRLALDYVKERYSPEDIGYFPDCNTYIKLANKIVKLATRPALSFSDELTEGLGFVLWDDDYSFFSERGFIKTLEFCDSAVGSGRGYGGEMVKKLLNEGGIDYVPKSKEQINDEQQRINSWMDSFFNSIN